MKNSDLSITDSFWNFIEANVPNYHEREDVLHQGELLGVLDSEHSQLGFYSDRHVRVLRQMAVLLAERLAQLRQGDAIG